MKASGALLFKSLKRLVDITVETIADRDALLTYKRRWGMVVAVYNDGADTGFYYLKKGKSTDILGDNNNWEVWENHPRLHDIDSADDHAPGEASDYGKYLRYNNINGRVESALFDYEPALQALVWQTQELSFTLDGAIVTEGVPQFYFITEDEFYIRQE